MAVRANTRPTQQLGVSHDRDRLGITMCSRDSEALVSPQDPTGFFLLVGGRVRQDCDLAPVKEPLSDAVVLLCLAQE
jgi:hypothetical protein